MPADETAARERRAALRRTWETAATFRRHLETGLSPRAALAATCAELGVEPGEGTVHVPAEGGPDDGHTFEVAWRVRGSSSVVGDPHHTDAPCWSEPTVGHFRAWNLADALAQACAVPLHRWLAHQDDEEEETDAC